MSSARLAPSVAALAGAHRSSQALAALPDGGQPANLTEAHALQDAVALALAEPVAGWKVALNKEGAVMRGAILGSRMLASPAAIAARQVPLLGIEVEIAFRFDRDLPPRAQLFDAEEVGAVCTALVGIEIVATRFASYTATPLLDRTADFMSNGAYVTGTARPDWRHFNLAQLEATLLVNGVATVRRTGGLAAGHPMRPTLALVNELRLAGGVKAGQIITAGTYTGLHYAAPGDDITGEFTGFGRADVVLTE